MKDPEAIKNWPKTLGRDGARTPMPWNMDKIFAGFSSTEPWLPIEPLHVASAIDCQENDVNSVLNFARRVLKLRGELPALRLGDMNFLLSPENIVAFTRSFDGVDILCVFNPSEASQNYTPPEVDSWRITTAVNIARVDFASTFPSLLDPTTGYIATRQ